MEIKTIILAAGQGTRMRSNLPKVLHQIAGKQLLRHVYDMSKQLENNTVSIVYGHGAEQVLSELKDLEANWVEQRQQLGTGHAVQHVVEYIENQDIVLILYGDVPLLKLETVKRLINMVNEKTLGLLTVDLEDPAGYGRIVRDSEQRVARIVEEKDAADEIKQIHEVNTGIMAVKGALLKLCLNRLKNNNAQKEYYLTDIIEMAVNDGIRVATSQPQGEDEVLGVNNRMQLAHLERVFQLELAQRMMESGVTLKDPARFDFRGKIVSLGQDIHIDVNVILEGDISLGNNVRIGANTIIINSKIDDGVEILPNCHIEDAKIGTDSIIGPFARIRPQTELSDNVRIGNFVEIKKSTVASGSKINHLSYIGDTTVGRAVNIGAGTITCNYDGVNKFKTIIEDGAFIGSDTQLVAPVTVGKNTTIGAGSTITKNTPEAKLTLTRTKQIVVEGWQRPKKREK